MNKYTYKNMISENVNAIKAERENNRWMGRQKRMCWKCQKDKTVEKGVGLTFIGNLARFICLDCMQAKQKKDNL